MDLGFEIRTIVSGIAMHFQPEDIVGKQVTVVVNLAPRKMRGIESNGMILMSEDKSGKLHFIHPETSIENGSSVSWCRKKYRIYQGAAFYKKVALFI